MSRVVTAADLVHRARDRLAAERSVDPGWESLVGVADGDPDSVFGDLQAELRSRVVALDRTSAELDGLSRSLRRLRRVYRFSEDGWPAERARLGALATADPDRLTVEWLGYVASAAGALRLAALHRLVQDGPLPREREPLRRRTELCLRGLMQRSLPVAAPLLRSCLAMRELPGFPLSGGGARRLTLMLARLALHGGHVEEAEALLRQDVEIPHAAQQALLAAVAHRRGDLDRSTELLSDARALDPQDLDVVVQQLRIGGTGGDRADSLAGSAVAAIPSFFDAVHEIDPLIDVPPALWLAVGERALGERLPDVMDIALSRVVESEELTDELAARVSDLRARAVSGPGRAEHLLQSGIRWLAADQVPNAYKAFSRAVREADPGSDLGATLTFRKADCFAILVTQHPARYGAEARARALSELLAAEDMTDAVARNPWVFGVESDLRVSIANLQGQDREQHLWMGLRAAGRSLALRLESARAWTTLADIAGKMGRYDLAVHAAAYATNRLGDGPETLIAWLTNGREYDAALSLVESTGSPWRLCVTAWIWARVGRASEASAILTSTTIDPDWYWARDALVSSRLMTGDVSGARQLARLYLMEGRGPVEELDRLVALAKLHMVVGDHEQGERYAERAAAYELGPEYHDDDGAFLLAQIRWLRAGDETSLEAMVSAARSRNPLALKDWGSVERPTLATLAAAGGWATDGLAAVDAAVAERIAGGRHEPSGAESLARLPVRGLAGESVASTVALVRALEALSQDDLAGVRDQEAGVAQAFPAEWAGIATVLEDRAGAQPSPAPPREPPPEGPVDAEPREPSDGPRLKLVLPGSWFQGYEEPGSQHPLFTRFLVEMRASCSWQVPPVSVHPDEALEPDRFLIEDDGGRLLDSGDVPSGARLCDPAALPAFPSRILDRSWESPLGRWVPEGAFSLPRDEPLRLLTSEPVEVVTRRLADAALRLEATGDAS